MANFRKMSKEHIAVLLFRMRRAGESLVSVAGELFSADELLTRYYGLKIDEEKGKEFITGDLCHTR